MNSANAGLGDDKNEHSPSELRVICTKGQLDYIEGLGWYAFLGGENRCRPNEL